jgi:hypothetical protein
MIERGTWNHAYAAFVLQKGCEALAHRCPLDADGGLRSVVQTLPWTQPLMAMILSACSDLRRRQE